MCRGNVGRSQMAEALFSKYSKHQVFSAGTKVHENDGEKIKNIPLAKEVIGSMNEESLDISENIRKQITPEMVNDYDKIIVMAEPETMPEFLKNSNKVVYWNIEDPKGKSMDDYRLLIKDLKHLIQKLIINIKSSPQ